MDQDMPGVSSTADPLARRPDEDLDAYVARLEATAPAGLSVPRRSALAFYLDAAQQQLRTRQERDAEEAARKRPQPATQPTFRSTEPPPAPASPLDDAKRAARRLTGRDREQFILWVAWGMPPSSEG